MAAMHLLVTLGIIQIEGIARQNYGKGVQLPSLNFLDGRVYLGKSGKKVSDD